MAAHGGFEHNLQSLRVVDALEIRYPAFDGLNLSFETREGILKHCSPRNAERLVSAEPGGPARRFLDGTQPSLEAQLVNLTDAMAYNAHDIDDGVRAGLITQAQLAEVPLFDRWRHAVLADYPKLAAQPNRRLLAETLRRLLSDQVRDLVATTEATLAEQRPADAEAARLLPPLVRFSPALHAQNAELKRFLFAALYRHPQLTQSTALARITVAELYAAYIAHPAEMPADYAAAADLPRSVADYIAGMTDRYAQREHHRLTGRRLFAG
jgi:dGTPase